MTEASDRLGRNREMAQLAASTVRVLEQGEENLDQDARDAAREAMAKLNTHEILCTERWNQQRIAVEQLCGQVARMQAAIDRNIPKLTVGIIAAMAGVIGFLADRAFPIH